MGDQPLTAVEASVLKVLKSKDYAMTAREIRRELVVDVVLAVTEKRLPKLYIGAFTRPKVEVELPLPLNNKEAEELAKELKKHGIAKIPSLHSIIKSLNELEKIGEVVSRKIGNKRVYSIAHPEFREV